MSFVKKKYDLIFSLGEACSCTSALRKYFLQTASYPFDWLYGSDFIGRCGILAGRFKNFIEKDDLELVGEERNINCYAYHNNYNDITFNHDFSKDLSFDEAYKKVKEKYDRRIKRLLNNIDIAETVLIVYIETPILNHIETGNSTIISGFNMLKKEFGNKVNLLYIKQTKDSLNVEQLNDNIIKFSCDYKDYDSIFDYDVKTKKLANIFKEYELKMPILQRITRNLIKILINLIPIKNTRRKLRQKYHI